LVKAAVERRQASAPRPARAARERGGFCTTFVGVPLPVFIFFDFFVARMNEVKSGINMQAS
jgi:hypothetical protein